MHRGPDDEGFWYAADGSVALGHRRLSILDLSAAGRQPMTNEASGLQLVLNGEIYNFRELRRELEQCGMPFRTGTDTEVLLAAYQRWGAACLNRLVGMFAFALYDEPKRRLLLARDRVGEKPLFYRVDKRGIVFASELKALLADPHAPRLLDNSALEFYLAFGYVPAPWCILRDYRKLRPGEALLYEPNAKRITTWSYWQLPNPPEETASAEELTDELMALMEDSVRRQLVADVPVGVLLSGGVDSSLVTALAARSSPRPIRTFTVTFPGHGKYDEAAYARAVAQHCGTQHTELVAEAATVDLLPMLARQYDEPIADSSMLPTFLVARQIRESATVALAGDGGDELFGGYRHYSWMQWQMHARRMPRLARGFAAALGHALPVGTRGRNHLVALAADERRSVAHVNLYFDAATRARLRHAALADDGPEQFKIQLWDERLSAASNAMRVDFLTYLPDDLLVKVDRASMLTALEVRAPFLDHRVVEFAFARVPEKFKVDGNQRKILPRRLGTKLLPASLDLRRKQGFSIPFDAWFRGTWGEYLHGVLIGAPPELLSPVVVRELFDGQRAGRSNTQRIFALAMLELWRREYDVQIDDGGASLAELEVIA